MDIFNVLYAIIRRHCKIENAIYSDCYDIIQSQIGVDKHRNLDFYLSFLQDLGLIKYSSTKKEIALTTLGKNTEFVFR